MDTGLQGNGLAQTTARREKGQLVATETFLNRCPGKPFVSRMRKQGADELWSGWFSRNLRSTPQRAR